MIAQRLWANMEKSLRPQPGQTKKDAFHTWWDVLTVMAVVQDLPVPGS